MKNLNIAVFGNKVFTQILNELNLFPNSKIKSYDNYETNIFEEIKNNQIIVFFLNEQNIKYFSELNNKDLPILLINNSLKPSKKINYIIHDQLHMPFKILNFEKKIINILAKNKFKKDSFIELGNYQLDKNERKISKDKLELKLTEKEINFLIFFTTHEQPISKNLILKKLWKYSSETDTHTVETHIHRLRKKILKKFNDSNFIKNDNQGYYI